MTSSDEQNQNPLMVQQYHKIVDQDQLIKKQEEIIKWLKIENERFKVKFKKSQLSYAWESHKGLKEMKIEKQNAIGITNPLDLPIKRKHQVYFGNKLIRDKDESSWNAQEDPSHENFKKLLEINENEKKQIENDKESLSQRLNQSYITIEELKYYELAYWEYKNKYESLLENEINFSNFKISNQALAEKLLSCESRIKHLENLCQAANEGITIKTDEYESELRKNVELNEELTIKNKIIEEKENEKNSLSQSLESIRLEYLNCFQQNSELNKQNVDLRNNINYMEEVLKQKCNEINIQNQAIYNNTQEIEKLTRKNQEQEIICNRTVEELREQKQNLYQKNFDLETLKKNLEEISQNYEKARIKLIENQGTIGEYKSQLINQGNQIKFYYEKIINSLEETISELSDQLLFAENELQKRDLLNFNTFS